MFSQVRFDDRMITILSALNDLLFLSPGALCSDESDVVPTAIPVSLPSVLFFEVFREQVPDNPLVDYPWENMEIAWSLDRG